MRNLFFFLILSLPSFAAEESREIFQFQNSESIELKGEVNFHELKNALAPFGLQPVPNKIGKGQVSLGVIEYPFGLKKFREVWIAGLAYTESNDPQYVYLQVITNNPFPSWLNDSFRYKLPLLKGDVSFDDSSFETRDIFFSIGTRGPHVFKNSYGVFRIEHHEKKLVSALTLKSEILTRKFELETDEAQLSSFLKRLDFKPKLWIIRKEATGTVEVPTR